MTIVERLPPTNAVAEAIEKRFLDRKTARVTTLEAESLDVVALEDSPVRFSLDGERRASDQDSAFDREPFACAWAPNTPGDRIVGPGRGRPIAEPVGGCLLMQVQPSPVVGPYTAR